jgi:hypothetical protein
VRKWTVSPIEHKPESSNPVFFFTRLLPARAHHVSLFSYFADCGFGFSRDCSGTFCCILNWEFQISIRLFFFEKEKKSYGFAFYIAWRSLWIVGLVLVFEFEISVKNICTKMLYARKMMARAVRIGRTRRRSNAMTSQQSPLESVPLSTTKPWTTEFLVFSAVKVDVLVVG